MDEEMFGSIHFPNGEILVGHFIKFTNQLTKSNKIEMKIKGNGEVNFEARNDDNQMRAVSIPYLQIVKMLGWKPCLDLLSWVNMLSTFQLNHKHFPSKELFEFRVPQMIDDTKAYFGQWNKKTNQPQGRGIMVTKDSIREGCFDGFEYEDGSNVREIFNDRCTTGIWDKIEGAIIDSEQIFTDGSKFTGTIYSDEIGLKSGKLQIGEEVHEGQFVQWSAQKHGVVKSTVGNHAAEFGRWYRNIKLQSISENDFNASMRETGDQDDMI